MTARKNSNFVFTECDKCSRKIRVNKQELARGIYCPRCRSLVRYQASTEEQKEDQDQLAKAAEELITTQPHREKCPACGALVEIEFKRKFLAKCASCGKIFIRDKSRVQSEDGTESPPPQDDQIQINPPPTDNQMQLINMFGLAGTPRNTREASDIILTVTSIIEDAIREYNVSFHLFPNETKFETVRRIIHSDLFPKIYFGGDEPVQYEEIQKFLDEIINDADLLKALKKYINNENMMKAQTYVDGFSQYVFNVKLDPVDVQKLALKAFARGFGNKLQPLEPIAYTKSGTSSQKTAAQIQNNLISSFSQKTPANVSLLELFQDNGYELPNKKKDSGCLFILFSAGTATLWRFFLN